MQIQRRRTEKVTMKYGGLNFQNRVACTCRAVIAVACVYACMHIGYFSHRMLPYGLQKEPIEIMQLARMTTTERSVGRAVLLNSDRQADKDVQAGIDVQADTGDQAEEIQPAQFIRNTNAKIMTWEGLDGVTNLMQQFWKGKLLCDIKQIRSKPSDKNLPIFLNVTFGCRELFEHGRLGTGNYIMLFYGIRVVARMFGNVDVSLTCRDADETKRLFVLPWLMGTFPGLPKNQSSGIPLSMSRQMCVKYFMPPLTYMHKEIQYDLRKMAIRLLGIPHNDHPSAEFAERSLWNRRSTTNQISTMGLSQLPVPNRVDMPSFHDNEYELDDAVLHFRCGDLMDSVHPHFAFIKFSGYVRHISPEASSIGILTQPFDEGTQARAIDTDSFKRHRCRTVVHSLVKYIEERHPNARVSIRNDIDETIALTFARMTMANQTINGISTFSIMPTIATFGTGYIRKPEGMQNQWLMNPRIDLYTSNVVLFDEPNVILVGNMKKLWENEGEVGVLNWFWNDSSVYVPPNQTL